MRAIYRANIATLTSRGVALALWSVATPRAIFPQRRIGALEAGFETNMLVLQGNPIEDFRNVRRIALRMKAGRLLH